MGELTERVTNLDKRVVEGYAIIWGQRNLYGEKFVKGCCAKSIRENGPGSKSAYEIKFLNQHRQTDPLSLFEVLEEDDIGLYFRTVPLDDVDTADRVLKQLKSRTLNNFSQGFDYVWDKIEYDETDDSLVCLEIKLYEISVVTIPAGMETYAVRSAEALEDLHDDTEDFIASLPGKYRLEARNIFARHKSLVNIGQPLDESDKALTHNEPVESGIDYGFLTNNFKLT